MLFQQIRIQIHNLPHNYELFVIEDNDKIQLSSEDSFEYSFYKSYDSNSTNPSITFKICGGKNEENMVKTVPIGIGKIYTKNIILQLKYFDENDIYMGY